LFVAAGVAWVLLFPVLARADANDPATGGCLVSNLDATFNADGSVKTPATCKVSYQLSALASVIMVNFKTGAAFYGENAVALGPCYGLTYQPGRWYGSGGDVCVTLRHATGQPDQYTGAIMLHSVRFGAVGVGSQATQKNDNSGFVFQAVAFLALKLPVL
jgi:hypothetical protein